MNFKKTLGLVLTAAIVSSSLVAVKPVKAETTSAATVVATAPTSALKGFSYFFAQRSLAFEGDRYSCVVSTAYTGKVQYEMWAKRVSDPSAKWQVVSKGTDGKAGYTEAVDGQNSIYTIPLVDGFSFKQGDYILAVYAKVANTTGVKDFGVKVNADGIEDSNGTVQKCDVATSAKLRVMSSSDKQKYTDVMGGDFKFSSTPLTVGKKVTFQGFDTKKDGAKYKFIVRKSGTDGADIKNYTFVNSAFQSTVDWTPAEAGTYEVIAWSEPNVSKGGARDGWSISTVTVNEATSTPTTAAVDTSTLTTKAGLLPGQTYITIKVTGASDPSKCTVKYGNDTLSYSVAKGVFYGTVNTVDAKALADAKNYTVIDSSTPTPTPETAVVDPATVTTKAGLLPGQTYITIKLAGDADGSKYTVKFGNDTLSYSAAKGVFYGSVNTTDMKLIQDAASYVVSAK